MVGSALPALVDRAVLVGVGPQPMRQVIPAHADLLSSPLLPLYSRRNGPKELSTEPNASKHALIRQLLGLDGMRLTHRIHVNAHRLFDKALRQCGRHAVQPRGGVVELGALLHQAHGLLNAHRTQLFEACRP